MKSNKFGALITNLLVAFFLTSTMSSNAASNAAQKHKCTSNDPSGCFHLAEYLNDQIGEARIKMLDAYQKSCSSGEGRACRILGDFFFKGNYYPKDTKRALDFYKLACENGQSNACEIIESRNAFLKKLLAENLQENYASTLKKHIISNTSYTAEPHEIQNPKATFLVELLSDCSIESVRLLKSSGIARWDKAALDGIKKSSPFPKRSDGTCPSKMEVIRGPSSM